MDANWRWTDENARNCYEGSSWDTSLCPDPDTCAANCALEGVPLSDWTGTYGVTSSSDALHLNFVTQGAYSKNVGSRTYLMDNDSQYMMFELKNQEFSFEVDVSNLPCGLNGALYFVNMEQDGGMSTGVNNKAGAKYGTGYCDAQCPHDIKFQLGEANVLDWSSSGADTGTGKWGACCAEMDIWEANKISSAYTLHPCNIEGFHRCEDEVDCGDTDKGHRFDGVCDKDGCDFNPYRSGVTDFFGPGLTVDTTQKMRVVTQFITSDGTANGDLVEVKRLFVQNGQTIEHPYSNVSTMSTQYNSITDEMCDAQKTAFGDVNDYAAKGGIKAMGEAMEGGMVLVMSLWDDHDVNMLWLDSTYPTDKTSPGGPRGTCSTDSGSPDDVENNSPWSNVTFSSIRIGDIGSTMGGDTPGPSPTPSGDYKYGDACSTRSDDDCDGSCECDWSWPADDPDQWNSKDAKCRCNYGYLFTQ
jgi:cellulose 1,4-beta-cellobiosidase